MSDQLTQCPHCQTSFRVTPGQLKAAGGLVRCGSCLGLFSAAFNFIRVKPDVDETAFDEDVADSPEEEAGAILLKAPLPRGRAASEDYEIYEEYEEPPDLLANLDLRPPKPQPATADSEKTSALVFTMSAADLNMGAGTTHDEDHGLPEGLSEEFEPRTILFGDEFDEDLDEDLEEEELDEQPEEETEEDLDEYLDKARPEDLSMAEVDLADILGFDADSKTAIDRERDMDFGDGLEHHADSTPEAGFNDDVFDEDDEDAEDAEDDDDDEEDFDEDYAEDFDEDLAENLSTDDYENAPESLPGERRDPGFGDADIEAILEEYLPQRKPAAPTALQQKPVAAEKRALHDYLATLEDEDDLEPLDNELLDEFGEEPVVLASGRQRRGLLASCALLLGCILLMGALLLQFVDQHLEALRQRSSFAQFEPWFCALLDCPAPPALPAPSSNLQSQELLIRSHPRIRGALELSFIFRNDAGEPLPFPGLELSFKDSANRLLANRLLLPQEYLPAELRPLTAMPGHSSVQVMLELVDPGAEAVNYTIAFRDL